MIFPYTRKNYIKIKNKMKINLENKLISIFFLNIRKLIKGFENFDFNNFK